MKKEVIGYKLKDEKYRKPANMIAGYDECGGTTLEEYIFYGGAFRENLEKAGVLHLWFEKVYKEEPELELNKWYKDDEFLVCYKGKNKKYLDQFKAYGFCYEDWISRHVSSCDIYAGWNLKCDWQPATDKEVEEALIKEAEKRGFKEGVKVTQINKWNVGENNWVIKDNYNVYFADNGLFFGNICLFKNGKWAEIISQPKEETYTIDIPKELKNKVKINWK